MVHKRDEVLSRESLGTGLGDAVTEALAYEGTSLVEIVSYPALI